MIKPRCGEVWETRRVFQGAVGNAARFPWPRRLSAAVGSEPEPRPPFVSKSLTRSGLPKIDIEQTLAFKHLLSDPLHVGLNHEETPYQQPTLDD